MFYQGIHVVASDFTGSKQQKQIKGIIQYGNMTNVLTSYCYINKVILHYSNENYHKNASLSWK